MQPTSPIVTCPGCLITMAIAATEALPMRLMKMTFRCGKCGTQTVRFFKSEKPAQSAATQEAN